MALKYILDTNIVLYHLDGRLAEPLPSGETGVSAITELELLAYPSLSQADEDAVRAFLSAVVVVDLTAAVKAAAIQVRRKHQLRLPDAIIVGTALASAAELLTNDAKLQTLPGVIARCLAIRGAGPDFGR